MRRKLTIGKLAFVGLALLAMVFVGCDTPIGGGDVTDISIFRNGQPQANFDLWVAPYGEENALRSVQLNARIIPGTEYYQNATWTSSSSEHAAVSNGGYVTAVAAGMATITATTATGRTASVIIRVRGYEPDTEPGNWSEHAGNLIILQAAAVQSVDGNAHRTFVELYNRSNAAINLDGLSMQYALGQGNTWEVIPLSGSIPAGHSFLILGTVTGQGSRLQLPDGDADMLLPEFQLSNRAFRLALMEGIVPLTVHNPSDMSHEGSDLRADMPAANAGPSTATVGTEIAAGLIDLLGVVNTRANAQCIIHGAKGHPAYRISNQTSIRRTSLDDATNNFNDFRGIDWQGGRLGAVADDQIAIFRPRNLAYEAWTPTFPEPNWQHPDVEGIEVQRLGSTITALQLFVGGPNVQLSAQVTPPRPGETVMWSVTSGTAVAVNNTGLVSIVGEGTATITVTIGGESEDVAVTVSPQPARGTEQLLILQANRSGNANALAGGFPYALVELFNNTDASIDLGAGNFSLHTGNATTWQHFVPLTGIIPARSSFLIVSTIDSNSYLGFDGDPRGRAVLPTADQYASFDMGTANHWRVAIMTNQTALLTVNNPFGDVSLAAYYVDMLGAGNNATAREYQPASTSQPQGPRRTTLVDTDNNSVDFAQTDFRGRWPAVTANLMSHANLYRFWPRNSEAGPWNPITGYPEIHPTVRHPTTGEVEFPVVP